MQIKCEKLRNALILVGPAVPKKPSLKVLTNARVNYGKIEATDLETSISVGLPEAADSCFLLPHRTVMDALKFIPGYEMLTIENNSKFSVKLSWSDGSAVYTVPDVANFPDTALGMKEEPRSQGQLDGDLLINAMVTALSYCATESERLVLTGIALNLGDVLRVAGADGFKASLESLDMSYPEQVNIVLRQELVKALDFLWHKQPGRPEGIDSFIAMVTNPRTLNLSLEGTFARFKFNNLTITGRLIEGTHPDILALLNKFEEPIKIRLMAPDLYNAVARMKKISEEGTGIIRLCWENGRMSVSAKAAEVGDVSADIPILNADNPGRIAIKDEYLLEYLKGKEGVVTLGVSTETSPLIFHYGNYPIVAVMPMKVSWEDKTEEDPTAENKTGEEPTAEDQTTGETAENTNEPVAEVEGETATHEASEDPENSEEEESQDTQEIEEQIHRGLEENQKQSSEPEKELVLSSPGAQSHKSRGRPKKKE